MPTAAGAAQQLAPSLVVYHCVDDYSANPSVDAPTISRLESQAIKAADVVLTTSPKLFREKRAVHPRTYYFPNLGNIEAFLEEGHRALILMDEIASLQRPVIGFVGNVSGYKVDLELIAMLADSRPKWNFVLIGPIGEGDPSTDVRLLQDKPNVLLLGPRQANEVPQYVHAFDVCLIPYRANQTTDSVFPLKFFEYLALGKPVVSTELESLLDYKDLCYLTSREKFLSAIEAALKEDGNEARRRIEYVSGLSWSRRINDVGTIIQAALDGRGEK
ncbi:glycosyltransferase [Candidatus Nitrospira bockiana]